MFGKVECVKVLVEAGANIEAKDDVSPPPTPPRPPLSSPGKGLGVGVAHEGEGLTWTLCRAPRRFAVRRHAPA